MMDVGTESEWKEGLDPEPERPLPPSAPEPEKPEPQTFHEEMLLLLQKHGLDDYFYAVRSRDGKVGGMTWGVTCKPEEDGYRARAAGLSFEVVGLLQHMQGSTWA